MVRYPLGILTTGKGDFDIMKAAIVKFSVLGRIGYAGTSRWDAAGVMEDPELIKNIERAEFRLKRAKSALKRAKNQRKTDLERIQKLKDAGDFDEIKV